MANQFDRIEQMIHIEWTGPFRVPEAVSHRSERTDYGLYQVCGWHPTQGARALLYLGKAEQQTFGVRLAQHVLDGWESAHEDLTVYLGRLSGLSTPDNERWGSLINLCEKLLIVAHTPPYNASGVGGIATEFDETVRPLHIVNWGRFASLLPEVSGARWSSEFDDPGDAWGVFGSHAATTDTD